ncbi:MAG: Hsp20/alpha crystallin family protein [Dehalococcoidia bacterium]|jgi:HSP20 family protein|nr:Hsp20/alpha crystallin family protein [Dehalococcoidia bacterium]
MMMVMQRFEPLSDGASLREAMGKLFEQSVVCPDRSAGAESTPGASLMPVNLYEEESGFVIRAYVPGVKAESVEVGAEGGTLTIKARIPGETEGEDAKAGRWLAGELGYGDVARTLTLPAPIDAARIEANVENGVLTVVVPKAEEAKPRKIVVTSK